MLGIQICDIFHGNHALKPCIYFIAYILYSLHAARETKFQTVNIRYSSFFKFIIVVVAFITALSL